MLLLTLNSSFQIQQPSVMSADDLFLEDEVLPGCSLVTVAAGFIDHACTHARRFHRSTSKNLSTGQI